MAEITQRFRIIRSELEPNGNPQPDTRVMVSAIRLDAIVDGKTAPPDASVTWTFSSKDAAGFRPGMDVDLTWSPAED